MTHTPGYMNVTRSPSGKQVRFRADFVAMINSTRDGAMVLLVDNTNQVFTSMSFVELCAAHDKALKELKVMITAPSMQMKPAVSSVPACKFDSDNTYHVDDDKVPF